MPTPDPINSNGAIKCCGKLERRSNNADKVRTREEELLADDATCVMSNTTTDRGWAAKRTHKAEVRGWDDDDTAATEPETEDSESDVDSDRPPARVPHMVLPWGGSQASKVIRKWKSRIKKRAERRAAKESRRFKSKAQAWNTMATRLGLHKMANAEAAFDTKRLTRMVDVEFGLSDSGASAHFIVEGAPVENLRAAEKPLRIKLPDGKIILSTHTCNLPIPWLPKVMTEAHVVPGLAHSSLISTKKFCEAGCVVVFDRFECRVYFGPKAAQRRLASAEELVLTGGRDANTGMWKLPINEAWTYPSISPTRNSQCMGQTFCTHCHTNSNT